MPFTLHKKMIRLHAYFSGRVQGVGFRWAAQRLAEEMNLSGWVQNLDDGRVELVAEGEPEHLKRWVSRLSECFPSSRAQVQWDLPASGEFRTFQITF